MKHPARKLLALLLCLAMCLSLLPAGFASAADAPIRVACVGDSITYGHNPASPSGQPRITNNWATLLGNKLGSGYSVSNYGVSGTTVMKSGDSPYWNQSAYRNSLSSEPDIVIIMLGTNDSKPANWAKKDQFADDLKALISEYQNLDTHPAVYVATSATAYNDGAFSIVPSVVDDEIVPLQKQVAREMGCTVIDVNAATKNMPENFPDNIHPNAAGHEVIAEAVYGILAAPAPSDIPIYEDTRYSFAERAADLVARMSLSQKGSQMISSPAPAISASALGGGALNTRATKDLAQYYWWNEGLHGYNRIDNGASVRGGGAGPANSVSYPQSLTVGSTWNPELYYQEALQVSEEIRERTSRNSLGNAIDLNFYSPTVNLQRDPRWGRNEESYSEDPYLTIKMGSQYALGLEGKNQDGTMIDPDGYYRLHSTIKHYVANNSESNRLNGGATTSLDALRNYYLAPYRGIIKATDISSVMTAYSSLNSEPCSFSSYLMDTLLRQTYGFSGHITSDCDAVGTMNRLNYVNPRTGAVLTNVERLAGALAHGEDLECNGGYTGTGNYNSYSSQMVNGNVQTDKGLFTENTMDISLHRLMTARISTGEFDDDLALTQQANDRIAAQRAADSSGVYNQTPERLAIVEQVNNEGVVMLQNRDNFLPLNIPASGEYKVVIVGAWQTNMYLGLYSASANNTAKQVNIQKGITDAIKAKNPNASFTYITSDSVSDSNRAAIEAADVCVVVGGANNQYSAEDRDRSSIAMNNNQASMFARVGEWNPNTVAVMEYCGPVETYTFSQNVKSILWSSFGGLRKGVGFGNIIVGNVNPSGKLTATWFHSTNDLPNKLNYDLYPSGNTPGRTYMYYKGSAVEYPFGYGLSFTTYEYSNLKIDKTAYDANDTVQVSFDVKNTGSVAGKEITQLYIAQPGVTAANRPIRRLEGFDKIELQPGETKTVTMEVAIPDLAYYNEADDCYSVDTGAYQVQVGKDSASADLTADFTVSGAMDVYPELLTVKANAVGDTEKGIEERLIYDKGSIINPQLTVCMNNEKLYGYIIKDQRSPIKSLKSTALPEGMTFRYSSNRPSVVRVTGDQIKAVGPGVATVTVAGTLDGHTVTADFVVYVMGNIAASAITVNGAPLAKFDPAKLSYSMMLEAGAAIPTVGASVADDDLTVTVKQAAELPGSAYVVVTDRESGQSVTYEIKFKVKASGGSSQTIDFTTAADEGKYDIVGQSQSRVAEGQGLALVTTRNAVETCNGQNSGAQAETPEDLVCVPVSGDWTATLEVDFSTNGVSNGYYQFFGFYAAEGDDYQNMAGIRGGDGAMQNFLRVGGSITADSSDLNSSPGFASNGTYWLRIEKAGDSYTCFRSSDGEDFTEMFAYEATGIDANEIVIDAYTGMTTGYKFTLKYLNVEGGGGEPQPVAVPEIASIRVNGSEIDFDPAVTVYNFEAAAGSVPKVAAVAGNADTSVEIQQLTGPTGRATVTAVAGDKRKTYTLYFNYAPEDDYFADGTMSTAWIVEKALPAEYQVVKGEGLKLLTQAEDVYQDGSDWHNAFTMPAMGNWQAVVKAFYPTSALENYQQLAVLLWEDADNYIRINLQQSRLLLEPGRETAGTMNTNVFQTANATAAADGTVTVYFRINKLVNDYTLAYSQDGVDFTSLGTVNVNYADPKLVLIAGQNSDAEPVWLNFEYVAVTSKDGVDANSDFLGWARQNVADYIAADIPAETSEDITLSAAPHGYSVSLASSDPGVISANGTVTPASADKTVELTVTVREGDASAEAKATVKVPGTGAQPELDTTALEAAIASAEALDRSGCPAETLAALDAALNAAKAARTAAAQADVDSAAAALENAVAAARAQAAAARAEAAAGAAAEEAAEAQTLADRAAALAAADGVAAEDAKTAARNAAQSAEEAKTAAAAAKTAAASGDAAAAEAAAAEADEAAQRAAVIKSDAASFVATLETKAQAMRDKLDKYIKDAEAMDTSEYTDESVAKLKKAIADAKEVLAADRLSDFDISRQAVEFAIESLQRKDAPFRFDDVKGESDYFFDPVYWALDNEITTGTSATAFSPNAGCTRAQVVTFLWRAAGKPAPKSDKNPFKDVRKGDYYYDAVLWAVEQNITKGTSETTFRPDQTCTRGQIVTFLWRYSGQPKPTSAVNPFEDVKEGQYYYDAVLWAMENRITSGTTRTTFRPNQTCTRAQIVTFLYRTVVEE